ncbi:VpsP family polysaccharide biosynthesis protein [Pseudoalteromonas sp. NEC-BIFX-2020_015]|uniref:VpsP family polysaccharide biosynthesis protein n=1 Tax=Pseudoalteromonas sp. NEC-BIFX-2020_015 TaxID=2729544 RepID=UPI002013AFDA|nr:VpsP family polysaccharide biosynthesis protein [Pseudoalteromonas sp. NEC-BIFX-2020_015]
MKVSLFLILKLITACLCLYLIVIAFRWGIASTYYFQTNALLERWNDDRASLTIESYQQAKEAIEKAVNFHPEHNHYIHTQGRVLHWGIIVGAEKKSRYSDVGSLYLAATKTRPYWSETWTDLARLNAYLYGMNEKTRSYVAKSRATGRYTQHVMFTVSKIYLANWDYLSNEDKRSYILVVHDSFLKEYRLKEQLALAKKYNKLQMVCLLLYKSQYVEEANIKALKLRFCE